MVEGGAEEPAEQDASIGGVGAEQFPEVALCHLAVLGPAVDPDPGLVAVPRRGEADDQVGSVVPDKTGDTIGDPPGDRAVMQIKRPPQCDP